MKLFFWILVLFCSGLCWGTYSKDASQGSNNILRQLINPNHIEKFKSYHKEFAEKHKNMSDKQRALSLKATRGIGQAALEIKTVGSSQSILQATSALSKKEAEKLYLDFGIYEEFLRKEASQGRTVWHKVCERVQTAKNTMLRWFDKVVNCTKPTTYA